MCEAMGNVPLSTCQGHNKQYEGCSFALFLFLRLFLSLVQPVALCASHVSIYGLLSPFSASFVYVPRLSRGKHTQLLLITPFQVCVVQA